MKWIFRSVLIAVLTMLSFTHALAYESPSGYIEEAIFVVDWSNTEPITLVADTEDNFAYLELTSIACSTPSVAPKPITKATLRAVSTNKAKPQRGYTKIIGWYVG